MLRVISATTLFFLVLAPFAASAAVDGTPLAWGIAAFDLGGNMSDNGLAVAVDTAGRVVVAGLAYTYGWAEVPIVVRFLPDGQLDPTFGVGGTVTDPLGWGPTGGGVFNAVAVLADGGILVAGQGEHSLHTGGDVEMVVARLTPAGILDTSFATPLGHRTITFDGFGDNSYSFCKAMALLPDGRIVVAGHRYPGPTPSECAVARLTAAGALDPSFSSDGRALVTLGISDCYLEDVAVDTDNNVVAAGRVVAAADPVGGLAIRWTADGTLDPSFDGGVVTLLPSLLPGDDSVLFEGAVIQEDGRVLLGGLLRVVGSPAEYWTAVRLLPGGQIDSTFGGGGWVLADFACPDWMTCANPSPDSRVSGLALEDDGRILIAGSSSTLTGDVRGFAVARLLPSGLVDPTFGGGGQLVVDLPYGVGVGRDEAWGLALSPSGHIALAGTTEWNGADTDVAFLLLSNGLLFADGFESGDFSGW